MKEKIKQFIFPKEEQLESKWWHRLIKVIIWGLTIFSFVFAIGIFSQYFQGSPQFIFSFEDEYNEIKIKEQELDNDGIYGLILLNLILKEDPFVLSENIFTVWTELNNGKIPKRKLSPKEFMEKQCEEPEMIRSSLTLEKEPIYSKECFNMIVKNYPDIKVKLWKPKYYSVFLIFLVVPIIYFGFWLIYRKIILYIIFGKK